MRNVPWACWWCGSALAETQADIEWLAQSVLMHSTPGILVAVAQPAKNAVVRPFMVMQVH